MSDYETYLRVVERQRPIAPTTERPALRTASGHRRPALRIVAANIGSDYDTWHRVLYRAESEEVAASLRELNRPQSLRLAPPAPAPRLVPEADELLATAQLVAALVVTIVCVMVGVVVAFALLRLAVGQ